MLKARGAALDVIYGPIFLGRIVTAACRKTRIVSCQRQCITPVKYLLHHVSRWRPKCWSSACPGLLLKLRFPATHVHPTPSSQCSRALPLRFTSLSVFRDKKYGAQPSASLVVAELMRGAFSVLQRPCENAIEIDRLLLLRQQTKAAGEAEAGEASSGGLQQLLQQRLPAAGACRAAINIHMYCFIHACVH